MNPVNCPLLSDMRRIRQHSADLVKAMRSLRRKLRQCKDCEGGENCLIMAEFNRDVQATITQLTEEWNLDAIIA